MSFRLLVDERGRLPGAIETDTVDEMMEILRMKRPEQAGDIGMDTMPHWASCTEGLRVIPGDHHG